MSSRTFMSADEEELTVTLGDGSVWKLVNVGQITKVLVWTPTTEVILQELEEGLFEIANTSNNETITVRRRS